ncbi:MAG TPA: hypothetical protein VLH56_05170 [Dissulfurispiraceae bacterium]|nr:hypothetical protein [Dissulfurispiraceae bacterium]
MRCRKAWQLYVAIGHLIRDTREHRDAVAEYKNHMQRCQDCQENYRTLTAWARENEKYWTPDRIRQLEIDNDHLD